MFCTNCGKELGPEDKFCAYCGKPAPFVPLFKQEAKEEVPRKPFLDLDWNIDGVQREEKKKPTESVEFNWGEFAGKKPYKPIEVEKIGHSDEEEKIFILPELQKEDEKNDFASFSFLEDDNSVEVTFNEDSKEEPVLSIEELEAEIFGDNDEKPNESTIIFTKEDTIAVEKKEEKKDKFYTFTQKQNAFLELLEKEKERLLDLGGDDIFEQIRKEKQAEIKKVEEERQKENSSGNLSFVGVTLPITPLAVEIGEDAKATPFHGNKANDKKSEEIERTESKSVISNAAELSPEEKIKLRYSDIFPRDLVSDSSSDDYDSSENKENKEVALKLDELYNDDEATEKPKKKRGFAKFIISLLVILIILEGIIFAIKFIAPESEISKWTDEMIVKAIDLFSGNKSENDNAIEEDQQDFQTYMNAIVTSEAMNTKTIGMMTYSEGFSYNDVSNPAFEAVNSASQFVDEVWYEDSNGNAISYGQILARTLAKYYDTWQSINQDESLVSINSIEIGEIKQGDDGFYVLDKVTYAGADGTDVIKYQTVYVKAANNTMSISELKEEALNG